MKKDIFKITDAERFEWLEKQSLMINPYEDGWGMGREKYAEFYAGKEYPTTIRRTCDRVILKERRGWEGRINLTDNEGENPAQCNMWVEVLDGPHKGVKGRVHYVCGSKGDSISLSDTKPGLETLEALRHDIKVEYLREIKYEEWKKAKYGNKYDRE